MGIARIKTVNAQGGYDEIVIFAADSQRQVGVRLEGETLLSQAVDLLGKTLVRQELVTDVGREVIGLILGNAKTWRLLLDVAGFGPRGVPKNRSVPVFRFSAFVLSSCLRMRRNNLQFLERYKEVLWQRLSSVK